MAYHKRQVQVLIKILQMNKFSGKTKRKQVHHTVRQIRKQYGYDTYKLKIKYVRIELAAHQQYQEVLTQKTNSEL